LKDYLSSLLLLSRRTYFNWKLLSTVNIYVNTCNDWYFFVLCVGIHIMTCSTSMVCTESSSNDALELLQPW
jgi:hypothetical protein